MTTIQFLSNSLVFLLLLLTHSSTSLPLLPTTQENTTREVDDQNEQVDPSPAPRPGPSPFVIGLFNSFTRTSENQPSLHRFNTMRSFEISNYSHGCQESQYSFKFNISTIKREEDVTKSILRVYIDVSPSLNHTRALLKLMFINGSEIMNTETSLDKSHFVNFTIAETVHYWVKNSNLSDLQGFIIRVQFVGQSAPFRCDIRSFNIVDDKKNITTQPSLIVYSYDHEEPEIILEKLKRVIDRQKRASTPEKTVSGSSNCQNHNFTITQDDLSSLMGVDVFFPKSFNIGLCGGKCPDYHKMSTQNSLIMYYLLNFEKSLLKNESRYSKCCIPTEYRSMSYMIYSLSTGATIRTLKDIVATRCNCVYTYNE